MGQQTRRLIAEGLGSGLLFACVVGSGIMAEALAGGNVAVALLGNTLATGAILYVLITIFGPISGAHFNPAVTLVMRLRGELSTREALAFVVMQLTGGIIGIFVTHLMFDLPILQYSLKARAGIGNWTGEFVATFGLLLTILGAVRYRPDNLPAAVALYIVAGYWFTSSTSFANPAIAVAHSMSNSFAGIAPGDVPMFVAMQLAGAITALAVSRVLFFEEPAGGTP